MNKFYYNSFYFSNFKTPNWGKFWNNAYWLGIPVQKIPTDLWIYQEIITTQKPDYIIECGTADGGSALFLASICDLVKHGKIISVDIVKKIRPKHKRVTYLYGSSVSKEIEQRVKKNISKSKKVMAILDSDHSKKHVLKELHIYSKLVTKGNYLIVEDTNLNGHPVPYFEAGPWEATQEFIKHNKHFLIDTTKEKFYLTFNPRGYLKKLY
ncbi:MAG: cephalosporin hydroxylase [Candidatus Roizmanbacteria bacterium]|nr:MAG: cephalosporin hydroxylase [Candidatus Roizmanbacteria bacterium]